MLDLNRWREWRSWIPADCPGCRRRVPGQGLCPACLAELLAGQRVARCPHCAHPYGAGGCPDCRRRPPAFDGVVAAFDYQGLGARLVLDYKLAGRLSLAGLLADLLAAAAWPLPCPVDWVVPVPARRESVLQRGFSPPAEVARILARRLHLPYDLDLLRRVRQGPKQSTLERDARLQAARDAYACGDGRGLRARLGGSCVVVVDDVMTTGATLHEAARALKQAGARRVMGWVLARAVLQ